ncbi:protein kinase [Martiniozyma asiatica (nom. inval.)]|nr:protein kinase [Martiniozyma asiatica]
MDPSQVSSWINTPNLVLGWIPELRERNNIDNEQIVPDLHWEFCADSIPQYFPSTKSRSLGLCDEYVPQLSSFNLAKFGIDENAIESDEETAISETQPIPIAIPILQDKNEANIENFRVTDEIFSIAGSPEREGDREFLSSIPKSFQSLSFSERRKWLNDVLPISLQRNASYKNHLTKIIRRNSSASVSSSFNSKSFSISSVIEPNINESGSVVGTNGWTLGKVINKGAFGIIRECYSANLGNSIKKAMKVIPREGISAQSTFAIQQELLIWHHASTQINSDNYILPLEDVTVTDKFVFCVMPLANGSLFDTVRFWDATNMPLNKRIEGIRKYSAQSAKALKWLHSISIVHADVKLENFVLVGELSKGLSVRLCDFGMARFMPQNENTIVDDAITRSIRSMKPDVITAEVIGSLPYAHPSLLEDFEPTPLTDIYALGVMIYALVMLKLPFYHSNHIHLCKLILEGDWKSDWVGGEMTIYVDGCLNGNLDILDHLISIDQNIELNRIRSASSIMDLDTETDTDTDNNTRMSTNIVPAY